MTERNTQDDATCFETCVAEDAVEWERSNGEWTVGRVLSIDHDLGYRCVRVELLFGPPKSTPLPVYSKSGHRLRWRRKRS